MPVIQKRILFFNSKRSLPFGTYGTPLADEPGVKARILGEFMKRSSSAFCLDATAALFDPEWESWIPGGVPIKVSECRVARLEGDFDSYLAESVNSTKRKTRRRCERSGIEARPLDSIVEVERFHHIYKRMSRGWGGIHPLPLALFEEIFKKGSDNVVFMGAFKGGQLMGGHVDFYYGRMAQAWQAGLSKEANRYGAAPYLVLEAIREAYRRGMKYFNLGSSSGDEGLIEFKESLGGSEFRYPVIETGKRWWQWARRR